MSPAGDFVCLDAALKNGADAVYFGIKGSNMRAGARNFALSELPAAAQKCREYGAKTYLTLNNIYFDSDFPSLGTNIKAAKDAGIDAVIAWDFAAIERALNSGLEVFLSTQASVANSDSVCAYFKRFGIRRFVLARECSLEAIASIKAEVAEKLGKDDAIEIEVFAHGAMCVSISGRCFMSEYTSGKSANRGECQQPCRRKYRVSEVKEGGAEFELDGGYVMSPKDLCTLPFIEKIFEAGADSLKIEGRNRNAQYVASTAKRATFGLKTAVRPISPKDFLVLNRSWLRILKRISTGGFPTVFTWESPLATGHPRATAQP